MEMILISYSETKQKKRSKVETKKQLLQIKNRKKEKKKKKRKYRATISNALSWDVEFEPSVEFETGTMINTPR